MPFMEPEIWHGHLTIVRCFDGGEVAIPECHVDPEDEIIETVFGFGVRLSAPGCLDCTEWEVFPTMEDAEGRVKELLEEELQDAFCK